ncbi:MAG: hypothetical protein P1P84_20360 [Deferrisomatales bacterium]|nr:hypothetical protein [Deferrisomatales bacterium]
MVHPVMARGIERKESFRADRARKTFIERRGERVTAADFTVYACCSTSYHFHPVLRTGKPPSPG